MSDPSCRAFRELLGVYVVGAIEPAERAAVDAHLGQCYECREELAALAVLPALLHRVTPEEAERIAASSQVAGDHSADLLNSLLRRVGARRRSRRVRAAFATAAAIVIAAGGAAAVTQALAPGTPVGLAGSHHPGKHSAVVELASLRKDGIYVMVRYSKATWGTPMSVRASGLPEWTNCKFWVVTKAGRQILVGGWTVGADGQNLWYPVRTSIARSEVGGFVLAASGKTWSKVLRIPAA